MREELLTSHHLVRVGQEIGEYLEDLAVEGNQLPRATQFVAARIQRIVLEDVEHRPLLGRSARGRHWLPPMSGGPFYNKYQYCISKISAFCQVSALWGVCIFFCIAWALCRRAAEHRR